MAEFTRREIVVCAVAASAAVMEVAPFVRSASTATFAMLPADVGADIAQASQAVDEARARFAEAAERLETSLPRLHPLLLHNRATTPLWLCAAERRLFDNAVVMRATNSSGYPTTRQIVTADIVAAELASGALTRLKRRRLRRILRRAKRYEAALAIAEKVAGVDVAAATLRAALRELHELTEAVMREPAHTAADLRRKAFALSTFASADDETWRQVRAGDWGVQIAHDLLAMNIGMGA